jgi:hypothetical protein
MNEELVNKYIDKLDGLSDMAAVEIPAMLNEVVIWGVYSNLIVGCLTFAVVLLFVYGFYYLVKNMKDIYIDETAFALCLGLCILCFGVSVFSFYYSAKAYYAPRAYVIEKVRGMK